MVPRLAIPASLQLVVDELPLRIAAAPFCTSGRAMSAVAGCLRGCYALDALPDMVVSSGLAVCAGLEFEEFGVEAVLGDQL